MEHHAIIFYLSLSFQSRQFDDSDHKKLLEDEQLKILSECSNKLVSLSLRGEKEERDRRDAISNDKRKEQETRDALAHSVQQKQSIADEKVKL